MGRLDQTDGLRTRIGTSHGASPPCLRQSSDRFDPVMSAAVAAPRVFISEVHPAGSGNGTYAADWFEVTNTGTTPVNITGWKVDDNSNSFAAAIALSWGRLASPPASPSSSSKLPAAVNNVVNNFKAAWFGNNVPSSLVVGTYSGSGVGLGTTEIRSISSMRTATASAASVSVQRRAGGHVRQHRRSRQLDAPAPDCIDVECGRRKRCVPVLQRSGNRIARPANQFISAVHDRSVSLRQGWQIRPARTDQESRRRTLSACWPRKLRR